VGLRTVEGVTVYEKPAWYMTIDEFFGLIRECLVEYNGFAEGERYHPEDLWVNALGHGEAMNKAFMWIGPRLRKPSE
jgi:hypothetical protein